MAKTRLQYWSLLPATFIALGFFMPDRHPFDERLSLGLFALAFPLWIIPLLPFGLIALRTDKAPLAVRHTATALLVVFWLPVWFLASFDVHPGGIHTSLTHAALLGGVVSASYTGPGRFFWPATTVIWSAGAIGLASFLQILFVAYGVSSLTDGQSYCLAEHRRQTAPVSSWDKLRGARFYSTKNEHNYVFLTHYHGLLVVGDGRLYNW